MERKRFQRIVTHDDLDGVVSAALCSVAEGVDRFRFASPGSVAGMGSEIGPETILCDLPHQTGAGLWFDHHQGNLEDFRLKGGDPDSEGVVFAPEKSCARVVLTYYAERKVAFPPFIEETVEEADIVDSFDYKDIEDWQRERPGKVVADTLRFHFPRRAERFRYMAHLIRKIRSEPLEAVTRDRQVSEKARQYREVEERSRALIDGLARFLPEDDRREVILLDTTGLKHSPNLIKSLAFLSHPEADAVLELKCLFRQNRKTNDLGVSMSLSPRLDRSSVKDIGEIMRSLNLGDGHRGAGAGRMSCRSKAEMLKHREWLLREILDAWKAQGSP